MRPSSGRDDAAGNGRPQARGKFLWVDDEKLYVKGVTYGTFATDERGREIYDPETVASDFAAMAAAGINTVRTYTVPPRWLLDEAAAQSLRVLVGVPWEQHVTFLDDRQLARSIAGRVHDAVAGCAGHEAVLGYAVGNEIPASIVRWHGRNRVERFIERLYWEAKDADPEGLVTYVNYPSTEYLELPFLDLCAFNVYLETPDKLKAYLARLQNVAGDRPLLLAEVGLDSRRNGLEAQAESLSWQTGAAFAAGCAGTFVFAWTDEWHRGGHEILDWDFGLTDRERLPKPALAAVEESYAAIPFPEREWPLVSVVVCSYNGSRTIARTCEGLHALDYPNLEVIVVDDGSKDATASIAEEHGFRTIRTENRGLSNARNEGAAAASGEYVVYLDDDAWPDPHWLKYLVHTFEEGGYAVAGGPNIPPPGESVTASCVARAPGGPIHVLFDDRRAEHVPGCNLAVRREVLLDLGGFDPRFVVAGDDVDLCWRVHESGHQIGFSPAAMVWHRRRPTTRGYLRQQLGYGRAEALLERKWPEKYNVGGHPTWLGRIYGPGGAQALNGRRWRVYYGTWGTGLFQRLYQPPAGLLASLPMTPEWWLLLLTLAGLSALGALWAPLLAFVPILALALAVAVTEAALSTRSGWRGTRTSFRNRARTTGMFLCQPLARLIGRIGYGLRPWWRNRPGVLAGPYPRTVLVWSEEWRAHEERVTSVQHAILGLGFAPVRGGDYDDWDLEIRAGLLAGARIRHVVEEHGAGRQLVRFHITPRLSIMGILVPALLGGLALLAVVDRAYVAALVLGALTAVVLLVALRELSVATALALHGAQRCSEGDLTRILLERVRRSKDEPEEIEDLSDLREARAPETGSVEAPT